MNRFLYLLFAALLVGCGSKSTNVAEQGKNDSGKPAVALAPAPAVDNKAKSTIARKGNSSNDPDLMDMEERYKALVNRIKPGMTKKQVEAILGTPDEEDEKDLGELNPAKAGQTLEIWTWRDIEDSKNFIILSFVNGRLQDGGTPGYDIRKGFKSKLPSNLNPQEKAKLKGAAKKAGIEVDDE